LYLLLPGGIDFHSRDPEQSVLYGIISTERVVNGSQWAAEVGNEFELEGSAENRVEIRLRAAVAGFERFREG
jgi:hypothetical protein